MDEVILVEDAKRLIDAASRGLGRPAASVPDTGRNSGRAS